MSLVDINNSAENEGFLAPLERCIKALTIEEMEKKQTFGFTTQANMELEGDFAITEGISASEFIGPLYLYSNVVGYLCADRLIAYYQNWNNKPSYTLFYRSVASVLLAALTLFATPACTKAASLAWATSSSSSASVPSFWW